MRPGLSTSTGIPNWISGLVGARCGGKAQRARKQLCRDHRAGVRIRQPQAITEVDKRLLAGPMQLAQYHRQLLLEASIQLRGGAPPLRALGYSRFSNFSSSSAPIASQLVRPAAAALRRQLATPVLPQPTERPSCRQLLTPLTQCSLSESLIFLTLSSLAPPRRPLGKGTKGGGR